MASNKTEKVDLLDVETNKIYSLYLNTEDAHKVENDINFASALLKYAKENISDSDTPSTSTTNSVSNISDNNEETKYDTNEEYEELFISGKMKQHLCWERVAKAMAKKDYNISAKKCCTKFQTLKRTYKQIKDNINPGTLEKHGNILMYVSMLWMKLYGTKSWIEPISTTSSDPNDQPVKLLGPVRKNKNKIQHVTSKHTLLEYRKLRAEKRDAQHKEKMDLLKDIKNLIQETLRKE
ncbi:hypothetical protein P5V15_015757 [Pogonomyrmex californicus]